MPEFMDDDEEIEQEDNLKEDADDFQDGHFRRY